MSRLDDMLVRARELRVRDDEASRYVAQLSHWARSVGEPRRSRVPWFAGGFALAATLATVMFVIARPSRQHTEAIRVGERVAIVAGATTSYRVVRTDAAHTEVVVERGTVTARLWPGATPHRLALRGDGVEAVATGTVFALAVDERGASVHVHEGSVAVSGRGVQVQLTAGAAWPPTVAYRGRDAGERLLALDAPRATDTPAQPVEPEPHATEAVDDASLAGPAHDASMAPRDAARTESRRAELPPPLPAPTDAAPTRPLTDRYRQMRLLRGQGNFDAAIAEGLAIADAKDATWSPIALLEAARIELGPRASPERAIALMERFEAEWTAHQLAPEARELRCRALRQVGRDDECKRAQ